MALWGDREQSERHSESGKRSSEVRVPLLRPRCPRCHACAGDHAPPALPLDPPPPPPPPIAPALAVRIGRYRSASSAQTHAPPASRSTDRLGRWALIGSVRSLVKHASFGSPPYEPCPGASRQIASLWISIDLDLFVARLLARASPSSHSLMAATLRPKRRALSIGRRSSSISGDSQERERAHLGFAPVSFIDNIINATNDYCCDGIDAIEEELSQALPSVDAAAITHACDQLQALLQGPIDKNFDKFELFALGNSFKVPDNLPPPPTYPQHEMTLEESELDEELEELRKQVLEVRWLVGSLPISVQSTSLTFTRSIIHSYHHRLVGSLTDHRSSTRYSFCNYKRSILLLHASTLPAISTF